MTELQGTNSESPCSPITYPCTFFGFIPSFSPTKNLNLDVSKLVPEPITLFGLVFEYLNVKYVITSSGLVATRNMPSNPDDTTSLTISLKITLFLLIKSILVSPGN